MNRPKISLLLAAVAACAVAGEAPAPLVEKMQGCADLQDPRQRLACFDREFAPYRRRSEAAVTAPVPAPAHAAAAAVVAPPPSAVPPALPESFGNSRPQQRAPAEEQVLHARVTSLREVDPGTFLVTLDNGQVWRNEDQRAGSALRAGDAVTIRRASLGTFRLTRDAGSEKAWIRTSRVR